MNTGLESREDRDLCAPSECPVPCLVGIALDKLQELLLNMQFICSPLNLAGCHVSLSSIGAAYASLDFVKKFRRFLG